MELGINNVSNTEYHADREFLSSSSFKSLLKNAEQFYKERFLGEERIFNNSNALDEGSLTHALILEPHLVKEEFAFYDEWRKAGDKFKLFKEQNGDKTIISIPQKERCHSYKIAFEKRSEATALMEGAEVEQTICAILDGLRVKIRCDMINVEKGYIADVKTSGYPQGVESFRISIDKFGYQLSAALYCAVAEQHYGKRFDFYFQVISKKEKVCDVYKLSKDTLAIGKLMLIESINKYKRCIKTEKWVDYIQEVEQNEGYEILEV